MTPRFNQIVVLPDRNENNSPTRLVSVLKQIYPQLNYSTPFIPPMSADDMLHFIGGNSYFIKDDALIVGFGVGGTVAMALQKALPALRLSTFIVNAPTEAGKIKIEPDKKAPAEQALSDAPVFRIDRCAVYSSAYTPIRGKCYWKSIMTMAYDVPWLKDGMDAYYPLAYLISRYSTGSDMDQEVNMIFTGYQQEDDRILG